MENVKETIAKNLVLLRKEKRMTQQDVAEKLNYSDKAISRWERAETLPDIETLCKLCDLYGVRFEYLLQKEQPSGRNPYVKETDSPSKIIIALIAIMSVWLVATIAFVYLGIYFSNPAWTLFIWAIPISSFLLSCFNARWWGFFAFQIVLKSVTVWTLILSVYLQLLEYNLWLLFIIGIPIQAIIILSSMLKKTKERSAE